MYTIFHWMQYLWNSLAIWQDQNTSTYTVWVPPSTYTHTQTYKLSVQLSKYICTTIQNIFFSLCFFSLSNKVLHVLFQNYYFKLLTKYTRTWERLLSFENCPNSCLSCPVQKNGGGVCWIRILLLLKSVFLYDKLHTFTVKIFSQAEN